MGIKDIVLIFGVFFGMHYVRMVAEARENISTTAGRFFTPTYSHDIEIDQFNNGTSYDSDNNASFAFLHLNEKWCKHLQDYPNEPQVILYPRMPKCGSSTMDTLFQSLASKNNFIFARTPREVWTNLDGNPPARKQMVDIIRQGLYQRKRPVVVEGHFEKINFAHDEIDPRNRTPVHIESIQLTRDCFGRSMSLFFYSLFQQKTAVQAKSKGKTKEHMLSKLNISKSSDEGKTFQINDCMERYDCVKGFDFLAFENNGLRYLCGHHCLQEISKGYDHLNEVPGHHSTLAKGALYNAVHPQHFTVVGLLSKLEEFLEMLECAYPNLLHGILQLYQKYNVHANRGMEVVKQKPTKALIDVINDSCDPAKSEAGFVYEKLFPYLRSRYQFMKQNKQRCCRKRYKK
jgi:hypothetical protein